MHPDGHGDDRGYPAVGGEQPAQTDHRGEGQDGEGDGRRRVAAVGAAGPGHAARRGLLGGRGRAAGARSSAGPRRASTAVTGLPGAARTAGVGRLPAPAAARTAARTDHRRPSHATTTAAGATAVAFAPSGAAAAASRSRLDAHERLADEDSGDIIARFQASGNPRSVETTIVPRRYRRRSWPPARAPPSHDERLKITMASEP